jgi:hypothetical protein
MASSCSGLHPAPKHLQIHVFRRISATMAFQELPRNRSGLDNESVAIANDLLVDLNRGIYFWELA